MVCRGYVVVGSVIALRVRRGAIDARAKGDVKAKTTEAIVLPSGLCLLDTGLACP
jgi:hypothetical protein